MATQTVIKEWNKTTIGKVYSFTSKPRGLEMPVILDFIPMEAISERNEHIDKSLIKKVSEIASGTYVENGDFLVAKITPSFENGKQGFVSIDSPFAYATTEVIPIQEKEGLSDKQFIAYWLRQGKIRSVLAGKMEGTTGRQRLSKTVLANTQIFLPPLPEQKAIARVLSTVQDAITEQENLITKLKELKRSMLQHLFTHGTKGEKTKMTEIGEMPESWNLVRLGEVCDVLASSITFKQAEVKTGDFMVLGVKVSDMNVPGNEKYLKISGTTFYFSDTKRLVPPGAIVFPKRGAAIATNKKRMSASYILLDPNLIAIVPKQDLLPDFIFSFFEMFNLSTLTDPGTIPQLNKKDLAPVLLPLPNRGEQEKIITAIQAVDAGVESARAKLASYQSLFKTLLHELMSGERRVSTKL